MKVKQSITSEKATVLNTQIHNETVKIPDESLDEVSGGNRIGTLYTPLEVQKKPGTPII